MKKNTIVSLTTCWVKMHMTYTDISSPDNTNKYQLSLRRWGACSWHLWRRGGLQPPSEATMGLTLQEGSSTFIIGWFCHPQTWETIDSMARVPAIEGRALQDKALGALTSLYYVSYFYLGCILLQFIGPRWQWKFWFVYIWFYFCMEFDVVFLCAKIKSLKLSFAIERIFIG
jgi:hypothetical protein